MASRSVLMKAGLRVLRAADWAEGLVRVAEAWGLAVVGCGMGGVAGGVAVMTDRLQINR
jgi:hypothetical protein